RAVVRAYAAQRDGLEVLAAGPGAFDTHAPQLADDVERGEPLAVRSGAPPAEQVVGEEVGVRAQGEGVDGLAVRGGGEEQQQRAGRETRAHRSLVRERFEWSCASGAATPGAWPGVHASRESGCRLGGRRVGEQQV